MSMICRLFPGNAAALENTIQDRMGIHLIFSGWQLFPR
jgi:hypothetical protein